MEDNHLLKQQASVEKQGQAYSAEEQDLIHQLIQARKEKESVLEFEDLAGYELPPRTQFSMVKKPAVSIKYGFMIFNMACIRLFEDIKHVLLLVHQSKQRLGIVPCIEEESGSVEWARLTKGKWVNKDVTSVDFIENLFKLMDWDRNCRYKVLGRVANSPRGLMLLFDMPEAIMFTRQLTEFVDKQTGEVKKRRIKYYPDNYKDCIGRLYSDYAATQQLNLFENFEGYTGKTYADAPSTPDSDTVAPSTQFVQPFIDSKGESE